MWIQGEECSLEEKDTWLCQSRWMEEPSILQFLTMEVGSSKKRINRRQKARVTGRKRRTGEDCGVLRGSLTGGMRLSPSEEANTEDDEAQAQGGCRHRDLHCLDRGEPGCYKVIQEVLKLTSTAESQGACT